ARPLESARAATRRMSLAEFEVQSFQMLMPVTPMTQICATRSGEPCAHLLASARDDERMAAWLAMRTNPWQGPVSRQTGDGPAPCQLLLRTRALGRRLRWGRRV